MQQKVIIKFLRMVMTMPENKVYVNKSNLGIVRELADKKGVSTSAIVNEILTSTGVGNKDVKPIVFQIPIEFLRDNKNGLKMWLEVKSEAILNLFYPSEQ